jgi:membrane protease YdiL (CAAX protease family)
MYDATQIKPYAPIPTPAVESGPARHPTRAQAYLLFVTVLILNAVGQTIIAGLKLPFPIAVTLGEVLFILVPVLAFIQIGNFDLQATLHLNPTTPRMLLLSMAVALLAWPLAEVLGFVTDDVLKKLVGPLPQLVPTPTSGAEAISYLFVLTVVPGVCEELLNRGVMQRAFERQGLWRTVFYVAIFFALFHLALYTLLFTFMLGAVLSYVVFKTNSIYNSMVCHAVFNSVTAFLIVFAYFDWIPKDVEDISWLLPFAMVATPLLIAVLYYIGRLTRDGKGGEVYVAPVDNSLVKGQFSFAEMALLTVIAVIFVVLCMAELFLRYGCAHPDLLRQLHIDPSICSG